MQAEAAQQPTGSITGPDGCHTNSNIMSNFLHTDVWSNPVILGYLLWVFNSHMEDIYIGHLGHTVAVEGRVVYFVLISIKCGEAA